MRILFERSLAIRGVAGFACILAVACAAAAGDDLGSRRATMMPDAVLRPTASVELLDASSQSPVAAPRHPRPRRVRAAGLGRPLRIAVGRGRDQPETRAERTRRRHLAARRTPAGRVALVLPPERPVRLVPQPPRSALLSLYQDSTLRSGDAVMLADGIHVFRDRGGWPHRPQDFVRLQSVAALDGRLRKTLEPLDRNPPIRWSTITILAPPA